MKKFNNYRYLKFRRQILNLIFKSNPNPKALRQPPKLYFLYCNLLVGKYVSYNNLHKITPGSLPLVQQYFSAA